MEKKKSHNQYKEIILGILGVLGVIINLLGVYFTHLLGIILGIYVLSMVKRDKENGLEPSTLGQILGWLGIVMAIGAIVYGSMSSL